MSNEQLIQGSDEWFKVRMGKITASKLSDLMKKTKYPNTLYEYHADRQDPLLHKSDEV